MRATTAGVLLSLVIVQTGHSQDSPDLEGRAQLMARIETLLEQGALADAESAMAEFRRRYPASSRVKGWANGNEVVYLYPSVRRLAEVYAARHDFDKVLQIYEDEIAGLTSEVPHYSWQFVGLAAPYYLETGTLGRDRLRSRLEEHRALFARMREEVEHPGRKDLFAGLEARMEAASLHLDLIGNTAPDFDFIRSFNTDSELTLASLRGKVVLIDFWATWCGPCMAAWPSLSALHDRWKDDGFEILSVTSLQGRVGAEKGLKPEREIELTREFIHRHDVTWPVLFSDRSVNDPEYGAVTLPTYVLIDRSGRIHRIFVGELGALGRAALERLVAEPAP